MLGEVERLRELQRTNAQGALSCTDGPEGYQHRIYSGALGLCDVFASSDAKLIMESLNFLRSAAFEEMVRDAGKWRTFRGNDDGEGAADVEANAIHRRGVTLDEAVATAMSAEGAK